MTKDYVAGPSVADRQGTHNQQMVAKSSNLRDCMIRIPDLLKVKASKRTFFITIPLSPVISPLLNDDYESKQLFELDFS